MDSDGLELGEKFREMEGDCVFVESRICVSCIGRGLDRRLRGESWPEDSGRAEGDWREVNAAGGPRGVSGAGRWEGGEK